MIKIKDPAENIFFKGWRPYAWVAVLVVLAYGWSIGFGFTYFDDDALILRNENRLKDISNIRKAFSAPETGAETLFYRPVLRTSFILNYRISRSEPWGYHLINVLLHLAVCLLFFELLKKIGLSAKAALICSLIFAVHPLNTQAVGWIPGRNDTLLALFLLSSAVCLVEYYGNGGILRYLCGLLFFALGLLAKESAIVFPAVIIGYPLLIKKAAWSDRRLWKSAVGLALVIALWYGVRIELVGTGPEWQGNRFLSLLEFLFMVATYFSKVFLPWNLSPVAIPQWPTIIVGTIVIAIGALLIYRWGVRDKPIFWFGLWWVAIFCLPYFARGSFVTLFLEHRFYVPLLGLLISLSQVGGIGFSVSRKLFPAATALILLLLLARTISYGRAFNDRRSFWGLAERTSPESALVMYNIGLMHQENKQYDLAVAKYLGALKRNPDYFGVYNSLGVVYQILGRLDDAEQAYQKAIYYNNGFAVAHDNLGSLYFAQGDHRKAGQEFIKAVELDPALPSARSNLGSYYLSQGYYEKAKDEYLTALKLDAGNVYAAYNLSLLYCQERQYDRAEQVLMEGLKIHPEEKLLYYQLSSIYFIAGKGDSAMKYYDRFLELGGVPDQEVLSLLKPFRKKNR